MSHDKDPIDKCASGSSPLAGLLNYLAEQAPHKYAVTPRALPHVARHRPRDEQAGAHEDDKNDKQDGAQGGKKDLAHTAELTPAVAHLSLIGEPPEVEYFEKTWSRLSTGVRLQQSQQQVPDNAGPLNSSQLIHRALLLMQDRSPAYLQHFLSYVETLSWMENLNASAAPPPAKSAAAKKPSRRTR